MRGTLKFSKMKETIDGEKQYKCKMCHVPVLESRTREHAIHHRANSFVLEI